MRCRASPRGPAAATTVWRRAAREGRLVLPLDDEDVAFVPIVVDDEETEPASARTPAPWGIETEMEGLVLRLPAQTSPSRIAAVVTALRSST